jgi:hypothetical protein
MGNRGKKKKKKGVILNSSVEKDKEGSSVITTHEDSSGRRCYPECQIQKTILPSHYEAVRSPINR